MKKKRVEEPKIGMYLGGRIDWDPDFVPRKLPPVNYSKNKRRQQVSEPDKSDAGSSESTGPA